jgi:hypothetical protein
MSDGVAFIEIGASQIEGLRAGNSFAQQGTDALATAGKIAVGKFSRYA